MSADSLDLDLSRALRRLADLGGQTAPTDARLSVTNARRLVQAGLAEAVDAPKLILTVAGVAALASATAMLQASDGAAQ